MIPILHSSYMHHLQHLRENVWVCWQLITILLLITELGEKVAARQIPCGCAQCVQKGGISMTGGAEERVNENYVNEQ